MFFVSRILSHVIFANPHHEAPLADVCYPQRSGVDSDELVSLICSQLLTAVIILFWGVTQCTLVVRRYRETYSLHLQGRNV